MNDTNVAASHDELLMLYQVTVGDLASFKTTQWTTTNYAFLLFAGIIGVRQVSGESIQLASRLLFVALAVTVAFGVLVVLQKLQDSIEVRQARLTSIRPHFSTAFNEAWQAKQKAREYIGSVWLLRIAVVAGVVISSWLLLLG